VKKTLYAALGVVTWKIGKRYMRRRARGVRGALPM
jgi:hypothetical protein